MLRRHNDVAGYLFSAVGVLYAVVLGFVVVVVWQKYDGAVSNVENEVDAVGNLYHVVDAFPAPAPRSRIRGGLRATSTPSFESNGRRWRATKTFPRTERGSLKASALCDRYV